jgi:hypothetical protein
VTKYDKKDPQAEEARQQINHDQFMLPKSSFREKQDLSLLEKQPFTLHMSLQK